MRPTPSFAGLVCLLLAATGIAQIPTPAAPAAPAQSVSATLERLRAAGQHPYLPGLAVNRFWSELQSAYASHGFTPLWSSAHAATPQATELVEALRTADRVGLRPADYEADQLLRHLVDLAAADADDEAWDLFDLGLSIALLGYIHDLHFGRIDPQDVGLALMVDRGRFDLAPALLRLSAAANVAEEVRSVEPSFQHYQLLKDELLRYEELALRPDLTALPALPSKSVKPGESYAGAPALRRLLQALGDLAPADTTTTPESAPAVDPMTSPTLDAVLVSAIRHFQFRHGLEPDGAIGPGTYRVLTTPLAVRVRQIVLTLERWRWLPQKLDSPPIFVNIPQFRLAAFRTSQDVESERLGMDVIVGKAFPANQTPVFAADMKYIVLRPYWDVPYSITTREMLPAIKSRPGYLAAQHLEIVSGNSDDAAVMEPTGANIAALASGKLRLRQTPGPWNALGAAKFMFPNPYNVYLHDTSSEGLFANAKRAYSHGCVRVANPEELAVHVLRDQPEWTRERIREAMNGTKPTRINLAMPIRVFILYGTAVATETRGMLFFEDIYGHDARLEEALAGHKVAPVAPVEPVEDGE
jgi:murein L,D-transpeptidase YcbB/YkuD